MKKQAKEVEAVLLERFGKDSIIGLATTADNVPYVRNVDAFYEDGAFYVLTYALSNKMNQIEANPTVAISGFWFTAHGKGINLGYFRKDENKEIADKMRKVFAEWIDNGHNNFDDVNTCILKIELTHGVLLTPENRFEIDFTSEMDRLFTIDLQDYDPNWPRSKRPTVRAIIERNGKLAMIHKMKFDYYAFPGGGIEEGESYHEALIREVHEETGLRVIPDSIQKFGSALRLNSSHKYENTIFEQENFYYKCAVEDAVDTPQLSAGEAEDQFTLEFVAAEDALHKNRYGDHQEETGGIWIERESRILEILVAGTTGNSV